MQPDNDRPDAAVAFVNAAIEHARVAFAVFIEHVGVEDLDDLAEANFACRTCQLVSALCAAGRGDKVGLIEQPHQLARVRRRDALALGDLRQRQAVAYRKISELHQTPQAVFLLCRNFHNSFSNKALARLV